MRGDLLAWVDEPRTGRGIHVLDGSGDWSFTPYGELARQVRSTAALIQRERNPERPVVAITLPTGAGFAAAFFGTLLAGGTPSPVAPPTILDDPDDYCAHVAALLRTARPGLILTDATFAPIVARAVGEAGIGVEPHVLDDAAAADDPAPAERAELALLQFTSGSTGRPRGVRIPYAALESNIGMKLGWQHVCPHDAVASWLPLYHDMGLIGCLLMPVSAQIDTHIISPARFIRDPVAWLDCFGRRGATLTASPTFGFAYVTRRVRDDQLDGFDLSRWRGAVIAAERLDAAVMNRFIARFAPWGLRRSVFTPAYGLAEATLAVTGHPPGTVSHAVRVDFGQLRFGEPLDIEARATVSDAEALGTGAGWTVACGTPLRGVSVSILDEDGDELPERHLGEIAVRGPANCLGYETADVAAAASRTHVEPDGRLRTADAGFVDGGELYVLGRIGDSLKVRGRTVYVEDLEARAARVPGVRLGRCVVFAGREERGDALVALVECEGDGWVDGVLETLVAEVGDDVAVRVVRAPRGTIVRTSSGKPRRSMMWRAFLEGRLAGEVVAESDALVATPVRA